MRLIDENGRLFGKVNCVDFLIIAVILAVIPGFFYIHSVLRKTPIRHPSKWVRVEVVTFAISEISDLFEEGDQCYDMFGNVDGRLVRILSKDPAYADRLRNAVISRYTTADGQNTVIDTRYEYFAPVFLEFELLCGRSAVNEPWYFRRGPLLISLVKSFNFDSSKYGVMCYVLGIKD